MGIVGGIVGVNGAKTRAHVISLEWDELKAGMPGIRQSIGRSALTTFIIVSFFEGLTA